MLSSVLNSDQAIEVNIWIMRAFVRLRELAVANQELSRKLDELERRVAGHDSAIVGLSEAIRGVDGAGEEGTDGYRVQGGGKGS